jgi:uncharacterized protein (TIGR00299 family) protein
LKTLYLECNMGAAGDMLMAALYELLSQQEQEQFLHTMNHLGLEGVTVSPSPSQKCGIWGTHMEVTVFGQEEHSHDHPHEEHHREEKNHTHALEETAHTHSHEHSLKDHHHHHEKEHTHEHGHTHTHHHYSYQDILSVIDTLPVPSQVKENAGKVYRLIGEAESHAHNAPIEQIHFHEVGSLDAVADVVGCCLLISMLRPDEIIVSPIHLGSGSVRCAHGVLPVPAPATAYILSGVPCYSGQIKGELCTPTGAALLKHFASRFGAMPVLSITKTGYGMGNKDFETANCIRAFWGESFDSKTDDEILELSCNLDDMTPEALGAAQKLLFDAGALDVFFTSIQMKKSRPGTMLTCLCRPADRENLSKMILLHTTTLGVRIKHCERIVLSSRFETVSTQYGEIRMKISEGHGVTKVKPEFADVQKAASAHNVSFMDVCEEAKKVFSC